MKLKNWQRVKVWPFPDNICIFSRAALSSMVACGYHTGELTSHMWLLKLKLCSITLNENLNCVPWQHLAIFQVFNSHMWLVATTLDSIELNISFISESSIGQCCFLWSKGVNSMGILDTMGTRKLGFGGMAFTFWALFYPRLVYYSGLSRKQTLYMDWTIWEILDNRFPLARPKRKSEGMRAC